MPLTSPDARPFPTRALPLACAGLLLAQAACATLARAPDPAPVRSERVAVPVFEWSNPSPRLAARMETNETYRYFDRESFTPTLIAGEMRSMRTGQDTEGVGLLQSGTHTVFAVEPEEGGYAEWTLPDFRPLRGEEVPERWYSIEYEFMLPEGTSLEDMAVPVAFRTALSPSGAVELTLTRRGTFNVNARPANGPRELYTTRETIAAEGPTAIHILLSTHGFWEIRVNGEMVESGRTNPGRASFGLSNKYWLEGRQRIRRLAVQELYHREDFDPSYGLPEEALAAIDEAMARALGSHVGRYAASDGSSEGDPQIDPGDWRYQSHERTYVRRMGIRSRTGDYAAYRVNLLVSGTHGRGQSITLPLQYEVAIDHSDLSITGAINLFFNDRDPYRLTEHEELFGDLVTDEGKVVLASLAPAPVPETEPTEAEVERWFEQGKAAYDAEDYARALPLLERAAQAGHADAQYHTARTHDHGLAGEVNRARAIRLYEMAAAQDHPLALNNLGTFHHGARGVVRDYERAFAYFTRSAELGNPLAMQNVGVMYHFGQGIPADTLKAARWYRRALAEKPLTGAAWRLGSLLLEGGDGLEPDHAEALRLLTMAAEAGDRGGLFHLGRMHEHGWGMERDCAEALRLYREAAGKGHTEAGERAERLESEGC